MKPAIRALHPELLPMLDCPRWDKCTAPICPLDREMARRTTISGAIERKCSLPKAERMALGKDLPWRGLWPRELASTRQWEAQTASARTEKGRQLATRRRETPITKALETYQRL